MSHEDAAASDVEKRYGTWRAVVLATVMPFCAGAGCAAAAWPARSSDLEAVAVLLWWVCLLCGTVLVLGPVTRLS
eukprot:2470049-Prymnesium_polylepis.1